MRYICWLVLVGAALGLFIGLGYASFVEQSIDGGGAGRLAVFDQIIFTGMTCGMVAALIVDVIIVFVWLKRRQARKAQRSLDADSVPLGGGE